MSANITSEQLVKNALSRYKLRPEDPDLLLSNVIAEMQSSTDSATFIRQAVTNSIAEGILRMERQAMAAAEEFLVIGQMSLFGDLIREHKIPEGMAQKSGAEVDEWMQNRARIEEENLDELRKATQRQERKTAQFAAWATATRQVCEALESAGLDPKETSYAEAIHKAQEKHAGRRTHAGTSPKRPVR